MKISKKILNKALLFLMATFTVGTLNAETVHIKSNYNEITKIIGGLKKDDSNKTKKSSKKELRGVWVASVINIDWPSKKGLSVEQQKREYISVLEDVKRWNMNAVFVQVKPTGDAFYPSKYSPWSEYLTGTQGVNPGYDPLKFMIDEAHKRGIEFHAWFNPYRLTMKGKSTSTESLSKDNIGRKRTEWTVVYGGQLYLNPGIPEVNDYVIDSIVEVVRNYDIDGVHMDDYFYPYKVKGQEYPDDAQFRKYGGKFADKGDWRRNNINKLVEKLHREIKKQNSSIAFGISPFGVWRNASTDPGRGSETQAGVQNYDDLYADILHWMDKGWIDYVVPQIYWNQGFKVAEYNTLVKWWSKHAKSTKTDLYIGQAAYRVGSWSNPNELVNQINYNRNYPEVKGSVFFSYKSLKENPKNIINNLLNGPYSSLPSELADTENVDKETVTEIAQNK